jgi:hypothetical protein
MAKTDRDRMFSSVFVARAELKGMLQDVEGSLRNNPALRLVSRGVNLKYEIRDGNKRAINDTIEFRKDSVTMTYFFDKSTLARNVSSLLKFFSVLAYLKDLYVVDMGSVYGYVIDSLRNSTPILTPNTQSAQYQERYRIDALSNINVSLAHELRQQASINLNLREEIKKYGAFSKEVL